MNYSLFINFWKQRSVVNAKFNVFPGTRCWHVPDNFGSIFKNPTGDFAARILEEIGLKGMCFKGVKLSEKHANFMVNLGDATYQDIVDFITYIKEQVKQKTGIQLECEVQIFS